jgi:hypothetical protein
MEDVPKWAAWRQSSKVERGKRDAAKPLGDRAEFDT